MNSINAIGGQVDNSIVATVTRYSIYTVGIILIAIALPWLAQYRDAAAFKENGAVEWLQLGFLLAIATMYFREKTLCPQFRHLSVVLGCVSAFAAVREMDANLDVIIPWLGWKVGYLLIIYAGLVGYRNKDVFLPQLINFLNARAFSLLWAGFIVAIPFAQLVGNGAFIQAIMTDDYSRDYSRMIEEIGELMGYGLLLIGSRELILQERRLFRAKSRSHMAPTSDTVSNRS